MILKELKTFSVLAILLTYTPLCLGEDAQTNVDVPQLQTGAALELYVPLPVENAIPDGERARIRSFEATSVVRLASDAPAFSGKLTIGANDFNGDLTLNIREGFIAAYDLLPNLDLRVGKFFLPFGILNQTRRSAWSFISAPIAIERFLSDQGVADIGIDFRYSLGTSFHLQAGLTNGYRFDSSIANAGAKPMTPTHFVRSSYDFELGESRLTVGANYLMRVNEVGTGLRMSGLDLLYSDRDESNSRVDRWNAQAEIYDRATTLSNLPVTEDIGGYAYAERTLGHYAAGLRADYFQVRSLTDLAGKYRANMNMGLTPVFSYSAYGHLKMQGSYTFSVDTRAGDSTRVEQRIEIRLVTEIGPIPKSRNLELGRSSL